MAYCDVDDIKAYLGRQDFANLTTDDELSESDIVQAAILAATEEIDGYVAVAPQSIAEGTTGMLKPLCVKMAVYALYSRSAFEAPEGRRRDYEHALRTLRDIAQGTISLSPRTRLAPAAGSGILINKTATNRVFVDL